MWRICRNILTCWMPRDSDSCTGCAAARMERVAEGCHLPAPEDRPDGSDWRFRVQVPGEGGEPLRCQRAELWIGGRVYSWPKERVSARTRFIYHVGFLNGKQWTVLTCSLEVAQTDPEINGYLCKLNVERQSCVRACHDGIRGMVDYFRTF